MIRLFLIVFILVPVALAAQFNYVLDQSIPVLDQDDKALAMPWAGGINAAEHNMLDLNNDGEDDLVIYDRMAEKVITFLNQNNQYYYAPEYELLFPKDITNWMLLRDYNCDGKMDLFTGDPLGIKVYKNISSSRGILSWERLLFYGFPNQPKSDVLISKSSNDINNLQLQGDDLPSISDIDGDGDLDIMNMKYYGEGTVELHLNNSMNLHNTCDSLNFEVVTRAWGNFKECHCGEFAFNGAACPPSQGGRTQHAGGKSLLALDVDGDADLDLLLSEANCNKLFLLRNEGTTTAPVINVAEDFPNDNPANFDLFPTAFYEDVDFDGVKDLIVSPSINSKPGLNTNLSASNWLYKNTGSNSSPNFTFQKTNFLQDQMIDVGDNAVPAFVDYDGDGDLDMFISQNASSDLVATISFYNNTGTIERPEFKLVTKDFLQLAVFDFYNLKIQFADLNVDGSKDLVFTATNFNNVTGLYYIANRSKTSINFSGQSPIGIDVPITYSENVLVTDIEPDGKPDLLLGKSNGALQFWKNEGALNFQLQNAQFLGLGSSTLRQSVACAVGDLDDDGKVDLVLGGHNGDLNIVGDYRNVTDISGGVSNITFNPLTENYEAHNLGDKLWPTITNLYNTNKPVIVVGNTLGGVQILRTDENFGLSKEPVIDLYPNPALKETTVNIKIDRNATLQVFSTLGQKISDPVRISANDVHSYKVSGMARGLYLFCFTIKKKSYTKRIVIY